MQNVIQRSHPCGTASGKKSDFASRFRSGSRYIFSRTKVNHAPKRAYDVSKRQRHTAFIVRSVKLHQAARLHKLARHYCILCVSAAPAEREAHLRSLRSADARKKHHFVSRRKTALQPLAYLCNLSAKLVTCNHRVGWCRHGDSNMTAANTKRLIVRQIQSAGYRTQENLSGRRLRQLKCFNAHIHRIV